MKSLAKKNCVPCEGGVPPLKPELQQTYLQELDAWEIIAEHHLSKTFSFPDFVQALDFVNQLGEIAEQEGHHPDILLSWGKVRIDIWTHKIDNLTESDFVLAAKIDALR